MLTSDFWFDLPEGQIAQRPLPRGEARMMVLDAPADQRHRRTRDLPDLLREGDLLVVNDTQVIPARLLGNRVGGGEVELLLVERLDELTWTALAKPGRRARPGTRIVLRDGPSAEVLVVDDDGRRRVRFDAAIEPFLERIGHVPLPPYIRRADQATDRDDYQTVFARSPGAIAAPTAGLHFTEAMLDALRQRGVDLAAVTLHVGIGTFKPLTSVLVHEHRMESERFEIPEATETLIRRTRARGGRVVAVGTTVVRTLEASALLSGGEPLAGRGSTALFITPGFRFLVVDTLLTNFHLPGSTLLLLACAFAGSDRVLAAYREAIERGYRFYSYGDAMLLSRSIR